jgi:hypothetical protein
VPRPEASAHHDRMRAVLAKFRCDVRGHVMMVMMMMMMMMMMMISHDQMTVIMRLVIPLRCTGHMS